jgi:hypothetical protein
MHGYAKSEAMPTDATPPDPSASDAAKDAPRENGPLSPAAARALAEAAARRAERDRNPAAQSEESGGRGGLDPTRYGDWEVNGLTSDF